MMTGNQDSVQETVVQPERQQLRGPQQSVPLPARSAPGSSRVPESGLSAGSGETNSDHQYAADISPRFDAHGKVQVIDIHTFPSGSCGSSSKFGLSCSSW